MLPPTTFVSKRPLSAGTDKVLNAGKPDFTLAVFPYGFPISFYSFKIYTGKKLSDIPTTYKQDGNPVAGSFQLTKQR